MRAAQFDKRRQRPSSRGELTDALEFNDVAPRKKSTALATVTVRDGVPGLDDLDDLDNLTFAELGLIPDSSTRFAMRAHNSDPNSAPGD